MAGKKSHVGWTYLSPFRKVASYANGAPADPLPNSTYASNAAASIIDLSASNRGHDNQLWVVALAQPTRIINQFCCTLWSAFNYSGTGLITWNKHAAFITGALPYRLDNLPAQLYYIQTTSVTVAVGNATLFVANTL